jgi:integrase/recombinase XerD
MRILELLPAFEANLNRRGRKASTVGMYGKNLEPFVRWIGDRPVTEIEPHDMEMFLDWYEVDFFERHGRSPANNTRGNVISALCVFFDWATKYDHVDKSPARRLRDEAPKREYKLHEWLRPEEDEKLLSACNTSTELLAVFLLRFTGLRPSEAVALRWSDVEWRDKRLWVNVREAKTSRGRRRIPVSSELRPFLVRSGPLNQADAPIFMTSTGKTWHRNQLYVVIRRVGARAGLEVYPRRLRKTLGSSALNSGASLATVSRILGHSTTTITEQAYAEMLPETVAADFLQAVG